MRKLPILLVFCLGYLAGSGSVRADIAESADGLYFGNDVLTFRIDSPAPDEPILSSGLVAWGPNGPAAPAGNLGLWLDDELITPRVHRSVEILDDQPDRAEFVVEYVYEPPHEDLRELRRYTLEPGAQLVQVMSRFLRNGLPSKQRVAVGLTTRADAAPIRSKRDGTRVTTWRQVDSRELGTAVMIPYRRDQKVVEVTNGGAGRSHALIVTETDARGYLVHYAGFVWSGAHEIDSGEAWAKHLNAWQRALPDPYLVTDPADGFDSVGEWRAYIRQLPFQPRQSSDPFSTSSATSTTGRIFVKSVMDRIIDSQTDGGQERGQRETVAFDTGLLAAFRATGDRSFRDAARAWLETTKRRPDEPVLDADTLGWGQAILGLYLEDLRGNYVEGAPKAIDDDSERDDRDLLHELYREAVERLYDRRSSLFRDADLSPADHRTPREQDKTFSSRRNGWAYAGILALLDDLPEDDPHRQRYLELYQGMTRRLVTLQAPDGSWRPRLNRPDLEQEPEPGGTSLFTFGLLAGINRGWLDARSYLPIALKGWEALLSNLSNLSTRGHPNDGFAEPFRPESLTVPEYGALLLAASELYEMDLTPEKLSALRPTHERRRILEDAAWTWYNDERALLADGTLYVGGVNSGGRSVVYPYVLDPLPEAQSRSEPVILSTWSERDDHDNPALLRFDDTLLAVYSRHHSAGAWNFRRTTLSETDEGATGHLDWGEERSFETGAPTTYANLVRLSDEGGRIYNFYRAQGFDPSVAWSDDGGESWQGGFPFILGGDGATRPYVKYVGNGRDRIDLIYTDGHPRREARNSVYHLYYRDGAFRDTRGRVVRDFVDLRDDPIEPSEGTVVYDGRGPGGRAWTHDLAIYPDGTQIAAFITAADGARGGDLRYWIAMRQPGSSPWKSRQIAYAGSHLYARERHYAGGIVLDPEHEGVIYISADVDPHTGTANGTGRFQIHRAQLPRNPSDPVEWEQLTFDPHRDNFRPFVPNDHGTDIRVLWVHGDYRSYQVFDCDIYGIGF